MNSAYPLNHYFNSGNREVVFVYCIDAMKLTMDANGLCRKCLLRDGGECLCNPDGDDGKICPFLEVDPLYYGTKTRLKQRRRR